MDWLHLVLALLGALGLGGTTELLGTVLPLLACSIRSVSLAYIMGCGIFFCVVGRVVCACVVRRPSPAQTRTQTNPAQPNSTRPNYHKKIWEEKKRTLLSAGSLDLGSGANTDETVVRLELLQGLSGVVDESEAGALATTVLGAETEDGDLVLVGLVERRDLVAELILGDVGTVGVEDVTKD